MDRIDAMQAFVAVADNKGFAPAARKLGLSPSGVTRLIAALEERLGARLLQRTTRSVALTGAGARYLERARRVLSDVEEAEAAVEGERSRPSGRLVVSAPVGFGRLHVSPVMSKFLMRFPEVAGELRLSDRFVSLVEDGVDLAIRIGHLADSTPRGPPCRRDAADRGRLKSLSEKARRARDARGDHLAPDHRVR
jgi:DNA-binding transcriptional LysR family regulator